MTRPLHGVRSVAVLGLAGLLLTACGGGGSSAGGTKSSAPASSSSSASSSSKPAGDPADGTLTVGTILPQTGSLAFLGPPEFAGAGLAIKEINDAGGVLGKPVTFMPADSGDATTDIASQSVSRLISQKADVIVGAASSAVSKNVINQITGAGVLQISPANTSPDFTTIKDQGLYFRTAPSDVLQGRVLGDTVVADGHLDVDILALNDPYGTGLSANVKKSVTAGGGTVKNTIIYDPTAANYTAEVAKVKADKPEAIVLIGFDESKKIVSELVNQGIGPGTTPLYMCDGNLADYSKDFAPGTLVGTKGTLPGAATSDAFKQQLLGVDPKLTQYAYAPEAYDAVNLVALAAVAAKSDSGSAIAAKMQDVSEKGTKCHTFPECSKLLAAGTDIDYDGQSGPVEFSPAGDPTQATIGIYAYDPDNTYKNLSFTAGKL